MSFIKTHFIRNFMFLKQVGREWKAFTMLNRSQREMSPLKEEDDYAFLGETEQKSHTHTQTPVLSPQVKQFFASSDFQEFAQFSFTSYGSISNFFPKFEQLERSLQLPFINSESFGRSDLKNVVRSLNAILPGNNFFWRVMMRFFLETSQDFFVRLQFFFLKEKQQGFKECLELFNKLIIRDFLERYLGPVKPQREFGLHQIQEEQTGYLNSQQIADLSRSPLTGKTMKAATSTQPSSSEIYRIVFSINTRVFAKLMTGRLFGFINQLELFSEKVE